VLRSRTPGRAVLFTGDVEDPAMRELLKDPSACASDVLVAPHHGSSEPLTAALRRGGRPAAVVSSNDRTLSRKQVDFEGMIGNRRLLRTHTSGAIAVEIGGDGAIAVSPFVQ
jgi:beta-lactamase superfamily II metal-dependent hydrolase